MGCAPTGLMVTPTLVGMPTPFVVTVRLSAPTAAVEGEPSIVQLMKESSRLAELLLRLIVTFEFGSGCAGMSAIETSSGRPAVCA